MAAEGVEIARAADTSNGSSGTSSKKRKATVLSSGQVANENSAMNGSHVNGRSTGSAGNGSAGDPSNNGGAETGKSNGHADENGSAGPSEKNKATPPPDVDDGETPIVKLVRKKWQMASCVHFFSTFKSCLPLSSSTANALTSVLLERAVGDPASDSTSSIIYREVVVSLLVALEELQPKHAGDRWFSTLAKFVANRPQDFPDCFEPNTENSEESDSILARFDGDGMSFIYHTTWKCRLGLLQTLCDLASEEADCVRDAIKEAERLSTATRVEIEARHYRLVPLGRCSQKRFYYCVDGCRIYSGYKRKGAGGVCVECSDAPSMTRLVETLQASDKAKDAALGAKIKSWYLVPLEAAEEKKRRKIDRDLAMEAQREESRRRNADRPRRARASYM